MNIIDFFIAEQKRLHDWLNTAMSELTPDEWHYVGPGNANTIAFLVWHCTRVDDIVLHSTLQGHPTIWQKGNWHERLGLPPHLQNVGTGTGMVADTAQTFHISDTGLLLEYVNTVWQEFEDYMASITDGGEELSKRMVMSGPVGEIPAIYAIGLVCVSHRLSHYGEIGHILGEMGKKGLPL